jgi:hypothetical protein
VKNNLSLLLLLLTALLGCKKSHNVTHNVTCNTAQSFKIVFDSSALPVMYAIPGDTVNFQLDLLVPGPGSHVYYNYQPNALAGCTILWNFGDGSTSTTLSPNHVYDSSGSYEVHLILNNDSTNTMSSSIYIGPVPVYTQLIAGPRQWKHTRVVTDGPTNIKDTTISDTTFAVNMVNTRTISIGPILLVYMAGASTPDKFIYWSSGGGSQSCTLIFSHSTNKIQFEVEYGWWMTDTFENI